MLDTNYQKAEKLYFHDKIMAATVLKLFPSGIKPNHVTVFRFLTTPFVAYLMFFEHYIIGLIVFLLVSFSDAIDGSMARTRNEITNWGKIYDPLADKVLIGVAVFTIVLRYIDFWTAMIIVFLEIIIICVAWYRKKRGWVVESNFWGKIKMILQVSGVVILMLSIVFNWHELIPLASGVLYLAIAFAIVSLLSYGI